MRLVLRMNDPIWSGFRISPARSRSMAMSITCCARSSAAMSSRRCLMPNSRTRRANRRYSSASAAPRLAGLRADGHFACELAVAASRQRRGVRTRHAGDGNSRHASPVNRAPAPVRPAAAPARRLRRAAPGVPSPSNADPCIAASTLRFERRQLLHVPARLRRERQVVHQHRMILIGGDGVFVSPDDVAAGDRLEIADLMEEIRAEQHPVAPRRTARRHPSRVAGAASAPTGSDGARSQDLARPQRARRTRREILHVDHGADLTAGGLRVGRDGEPFVQRAALVHFEVTPANPAQRGRIDQAGHRLAHLREHPPHAGVEQQRLLVLDEEVVELQVELRSENRDSEDVWGDFVDLGHGNASYAVFT